MVVRELPISSIKVGRRFRSDVGNIRELAESIADVGLLHPIVVDEYNTLVAGKRRFLACKQLGWKKIKANVITIGEIVKGEFHENQFRKNFTPSELVRIKEYIAKTRQGHRPKKGWVNDSPFPKGKTRDLMAKSLGMSSKTLQKAESIVKAAKANPKKYKPLLDKVDSGELSIEYASKKIASDQRRDVVVELPDGIYSVIYADPALRYDIALRGDPAQHYNTMEVEEICNIDVPSISAKDAALFLWATSPNLQAALKIMDAWGFEYRSKAVWVKISKESLADVKQELKLKIGTGHWWRGAHEDLLLGIKGNMPIPAPEDRFPSVIFATVGEHSRKPSIVYDMIEDMFPNKSYVELFARGQPYNAKWEIWGNEAVQQRQRNILKRVQPLVNKQ